MNKKRCAAVAAALILIAVSGLGYRASLDAVSGASRKHRHRREDPVYLLGLPPRSKGLADSALRATARAALNGEQPRVSGSPRLRLACEDGDTDLGGLARMLKNRLEAAGFRVALSMCSPALLRSKALAGKCDIFVAPRRTILRSDIERLGAAPLHLPCPPERRKRP